MRMGLDYGWKERVVKHVNEYLLFYVIGVFSICFGMVVGIYTAKYMNISYKDGLVEVMSRNSSILNDGSVTTFEYFLRVVRGNMEIMLVLFIMGLSVIGAPLVYLVDAYKGFSLGFSFAFMVNAFGSSGVLVALVGLVFFNLIYIPIVLYASVVAVENSVDIIKNGLGKNRSWSSTLLNYAGRYIIITFIVIAVNFLQCFIYPLLLSNI